ncbi:glutamate--tRNA ligase, partial [Candidatus Kaiserbacteria bacterium]|nr:glutamate--tRNA ligase [Candidatus Kaiserbacteria bacterium]
MNFNFFTKLFSSKKVVVRIAPSPTGLLHLGTARTALFNYLYAKRYGGKFIVRIEDTDKERSKDEYEKDVLEGLSWLGITHDELFRQSERTEIYTSYLKKLINSGKAFVSKEESTQNPGTHIEVVRLKNPGEKITFMDEIRGEITFDTTDLGDFVIARTLTEPLYHLAVVVDDYEMDVTHVIRGEDHISNTPRQILIQRALGFREPKYAHIPLILASDRSKMSKRKGSTSISEYRENGYVKEALINYLAFLGWNPGTEKEVYSLEELINDFSLEQVQKGGAVFDIQKLNWFNQQHLRALSPECYIELLETRNNIPKGLKQLPQYSHERFNKMIKEETERVTTLKELEELINKREFNYYFDSPKIDAKLTWKEEGSDTAKKHLGVVIEKLQTLSENAFTTDAVKETLWGYAEEVGKGSVLWPMRVALSGKEKSPDPFTLAEIFGKEETIN